MRVKHVMTKDPSSCLPSDSAQHAARIVSDEDAGIVPVIDKELSQKVVSVVTDRDLCMIASGASPRHETLKSVSAPSDEPSTPRAQSRSAA